MPTQGNLGDEDNIDDIPLNNNGGAMTEATADETVPPNGSPEKNKSESRPGRFNLSSVVESSVRSIQSAVSEVLLRYGASHDDSSLTKPFPVTAAQLATLSSERTREALADLLEQAITSENTPSATTTSGGGAPVEIEMTAVDSKNDVETPGESTRAMHQVKKLIKRLRHADSHGPYPSGSKEAANAERDMEIAATALAGYVLRSSPEEGLSPNKVGLDFRKSQFGENAIADKKLESFLKLCWDASQDHVLILLIVLGIITIIVETTIALEPGEKCGHCFAEGAAILIAVIIVVLTTASIDYAKQLAFIKLTKALDNTNTKSVIRNGEQMKVTDNEIVVGDILSVNSHNLASIPADCVVLGPTSGVDLKMDESTLTGESKEISKKPGDVVLSGTNAMSGTGKMVVIAVGINSVAGKIKARVYESDALNEENDFESESKTPLFIKLDRIAHQIGLAGTFAAVVAFLAMAIRGLAINKEDVKSLIDYLVTAITVLAVAVPEGLPLAVTLSLAFSSNKMTKDQNLVKHLDACETMGCATTICTDKTGTLTANKMTARAIFTCNNNFICSDPAQTLGSLLLSSPLRPSEQTISIICKLISIATMNESNLVFSEEDGKIQSSSGNPTECALLTLIYDLGVNYKDMRNETRGRADRGDLAEYYAEGKQMSFTSARKMMSWAVPQLEAGEIVGYRLYSKGAAEVMISRCSDVCMGGGSGTEREAMTTETSGIISDSAEKYARRGMRCLVLAFKDLPADADFDELSSVVKNSDGTEALVVETNMTFMALVGIEDPLRAEVPGAIDKCYEAGIDVRMVTGDSPNTAVSIAYQAGILKPFHFHHPENTTVSELGVDGHEPEDKKEMVATNLKKNILMEGKAFREKVYRQSDDGTKEFDQAAFDAIWPHLRVLARSSPDDKLTLAHGLNQSTLFTNQEKVKELKKIHDIKIFPDRQVIAMTGDGTNDAPALKRADIGFAMGISGTQIAKDAADIILLDDNFASIVTAAKWGRNVYASIQKFLQFQLTVNISAVVVALVGSFAYNKSPLAAIQLLWVNLLMDALASLALASEPPNDGLLQRPPVNRSDSMVTNRMFFNMFGQAAYQITVIMVLLFEGPEIFGFPPGHLVEKDDGLYPGSQKENSLHYTVIFNTFVWMTLFNEVNCRNLKGEFRVFHGLLNNPLFCGVLLTTSVLQIILVQYGSVIFHTVEGGLNGKYWGISLAFGVGSLPWQQFINVIYMSAGHYKNWRENKRVAKDRDMTFRQVPPSSGRSVDSLRSK